MFGNIDHFSGSVRESRTHDAAIINAGPRRSQGPQSGPGGLSFLPE
jgi:hypothetical protein